jgi:mono/diheme cytochrome c family protein
MPLNTRHLALAEFVVAASSLSAAPDWKQVEPMLAAKCYECHNADKMKGDVDLKKFAANPDVPVNFQIWNTVKDTIDNGDMPPRKAKQLTSEEKAGITGWVQHSLDLLAEAKSGDPGPVTMRRLTNAEYDYTIRDLTGRDSSLARASPIPATCFS